MQRHPLTFTFHKLPDQETSGKIFICCLNFQEFQDSQKCRIQSRLKAQGVEMGGSWVFEGLIRCHSPPFSLNKAISDPLFLVIHRNSHDLMLWTLSGTEHIFAVWKRLWDFLQVLLLFAVTWIPKLSKSEMNKILVV